MIGYLQVAAAAVAVLVAFWPNVRDVLASVSWEQQQQQTTRPSAASYRDAIYYLAEVRRRLVATQTLDDERRKAIDSLTLALVEGSDK